MGQATGKSKYECPANSGNASRFFFNAGWSYEVAEQLAAADPVRYVAKASRRERDGGLHGHCSHPTVKPITLAKWLATLLLPPVQYAPRRLLVPFAGVGSEMIGAMLAGWEEVLGVEMMPEYVDIARARIAHWQARPQQSRLQLEAAGGVRCSAALLAPGAASARMR